VWKLLFTVGKNLSIARFFRSTEPHLLLDLLLAGLSDRRHDDLLERLHQSSRAQKPNRAMGRAPRGCV
jgi:hypothetical protein